MGILRKWNGSLRWRPDLLECGEAAGRAHARRDLFFAVAQMSSERGGGVGGECARSEALVTILAKRKSVERGSRTILRVAQIRSGLIAPDCASLFFSECCAAEIRLQRLHGWSPSKVCATAWERGTCCEYCTTIVPQATDCRTTQWAPIDRHKARTTPACAMRDVTREPW
jgi:hypothetical protein